MQVGRRSTKTWGAAVGALALVMTLAVPAVSAPRTADTDERRTDPVAHRYVHGTLGDADYQVALPDDWNGKLLVWSRGFSGDEYQGDADAKILALQLGYAYAASDEGWNRFTIAEHPEDQYFESRRRVVQLTQHAQTLIRRHYGQPAQRTYLAGASNGGHTTKWLVEDYPQLFDGGVSLFGYNSLAEVFRSGAAFLRGYPVIEARIADVIAARAADPDWDPATDALDPPLTPEQVAALEGIYDVESYLRNGFTYDSGRAEGSEWRWPFIYPVLVAYIADSIGAMDPSYDPDGDGQVSLAEMEQWDPDDTRTNVTRQLHKLDVDGSLQRPLIVGHGTVDTIVPPSMSVAYQELVEWQLGKAGADEVLRTYMIAGLGHGGPQVMPFLEAALDALDAWVNYRSTGGDEGSLPPETLAGWPSL